MEKILHRSEERGKASGSMTMEKSEHGWLSSRFSFSFADWYDPTRMGFGVLRVINDDRIAPTSGFGAHPHRDMEIITIVTAGTVTHKDSMGNVGTVPVGDVQVMSAGTGVVHSEYNDSPTEALTLFQIWIESNKKGVEPRYGQKSFGLENKKAGITLLVGPDGSEGLPIHQDAYIYSVVVDAERPLMYSLSSEKNGAYIFVIEGDLSVADMQLHERDAVGIWDTQEIKLSSSEGAHLLIIDVPME